MEVEVTPGVLPWNVVKAIDRANRQINVENYIETKDMDILGSSMATA